MGCAGCGHKYRSYPRTSTPPQVTARVRRGRRIGVIHPVAVTPPAEPAAPSSEVTPESEDTLKAPNEG
jgi:hypothetical protein